MERAKNLKQHGGTLRCIGIGMCRKLCLELGRPSPAREHTRKERTYKPEQVKGIAAGRESEGDVVPRKQGQQNLVEGRTPASFMGTEEVRVSECQKG
jgi:hypothetical protein